MDKHRKNWETPQLIILARGMPEENVLEHCKTKNPNQPATGMLTSQQDTCAAGDGFTNCSNCQSRANSGS